MNNNPYFYTHVQHIPQQVWDIPNDTGEYPLVTVFDDHYTLVVPQEILMKPKEVTLIFPEPISGLANLVTNKGLEWASLWSTVDSIEEEKEMKRAKGALRP